MAASERHKAHDRLLAHMRRTEQRLAAMAGRIEELEEQDRVVIGEERDALAGQCEELSEEIRSWTEVEIGVPTAVQDLESAVDTLEADLNTVEPAESRDRLLAIEGQVKAWKRRVEWLRLQGALGAMEARDDLESLNHRLDGVRGDVLVELQRAAGDSKEVFVDLRKDVEKVLGDVRRAVRKTASGLTSR